MYKIKNKQNGFGLLEAIFVIVVIIVIAAGGWAIYRHDHKSKNTSSSSISTTKTSKSTNSQTSSVYSGWKTYCDTSSTNCFEYPSGWTLTTSSSSVSVRNDANTVLVSYASNFNKDNGTASFYIKSINHTVTASSLKIIGGAYTSNDTPIYSLVDDSTLSTYPLTAGQTSTYYFTSRFTDNNSSAQSQLTAYPIGTVFNSLTQAQQWFTSSGAKTALQILESFYFKP
jgi:hypothetical protein